MEYHKIETLFERKEDFTVDVERLKHPVIATISQWDVSEKVDGTNIRVLMSEQGDVTFNGRSDNAQIHSDLFKYLVSTFTPSKMVAAFTRDGEPLPSVVLYGEGYGAGIQKGGAYRSDKSFRLFDVLVGGKWWLDQLNTLDVAGKLGIKAVPVLGRWTLAEIVERVRVGFPSVVAMDDSGNAGLQAEGIVARPIETLFDKRGKRLIIKLKTKDFGK